MPTCFFDTCALVPRYRTGKFTYRVNRVFSSGKQIFIAEITMVEIVSAFASVCRDSHLPDSEFHRMCGEFLDDVADELVKVRPMDRADMNRATHLLALGGVVNGRALKSSDALVAVSCKQLALDRQERLLFYTKDWKLYRTLYEINAYRSALKLRFLGRGRGGIPAANK
jgi:hypothetical protein